MIKKNTNTILVVDDEPKVGMIFSKVLSDRGYALEHCASAEEALERVRAAPSLKMVFLDIRLPGMDGVTVLPKLLEINPELRVVMMTAYQTVESVVQAVKSGAVDYLVKPLDPQIVLQAVEKYASPSGGSAATSAGLSSAEAAVRAPGPQGLSEFAVHTPFMQEILEMAERFAGSPGTVLILGESGTGKELLSQYIHQKSPRKNKPFVVVDCAAIPESLFESELFGYEKGAFTGADSAKAGRLEQAAGGTLFLDEIGNVPLIMQAKLLRFIEDHRVVRLGGKRSVELDIRLIVATNSELQKAVAKGAFRQDLYYRLSALTLHLPPLRNRPKDEKEFLVLHLLKKNAAKLGRPCPSLSEGARQLILDYPWPGNVRELQNALYSAILMNDSGALQSSHFPVGIQSYLSHKEQVTLAPDAPDKTLRQILKKVEREQILSTLKQTNGNKKKASEILDMDYKTFLTKLKEYAGDEA